MIEYSFLSPLYRILKDLLLLIRGKRRQLSASDIVRLRSKWKVEIEEKLFERRRHKNASVDVIIRDVRRANTYPEIPDEKGISPWFRAGLMDTYHRGVQIGLSWTSLTLGERGLRQADYSQGETGEVKVILIGFVPFENIEAIDWNGDEYYGYPHIFCHFAHGKQPYERLAYCEKRELNNIAYYSEIADYEQIRERSRKAGIPHAV